MLKNHWFFNVFGDFEGSRSEVVFGGSWEASWGVLGGAVGAVLGASWAPLGRFLGYLVFLWTMLRTFCVVLGGFWAVLGASWVVLDLLGPFLGRHGAPSRLDVPRGPFWGRHDALSCLDAPRGFQDTPRRF